MSNMSQNCCEVSFWTEVERQLWTEVERQLCTVVGRQLYSGREAVVYKSVPTTE